MADLSEAEMRARYAKIRAQFFPVPVAKARAVQPYAKRHGKVSYVGKETRREGSGMYRGRRAEGAPA